MTSVLNFALADAPRVGAIACRFTSRSPRVAPSVAGASTFASATVAARQRRPVALGVAVALVECLVNHARHRPTGNRHRLASSGLPLVLQVRDLIARLADENRLWGAPRIHGELLKLGIVVAERTVSRYLRGRPRAPSQTWRTFLANHLGQVTFISEPSSYAAGDEVVDALARACRSSPPSDRLGASTHCLLVDWPAPVRRTCLGGHFTQDHVRERSRLRTRAARAPPRNVGHSPLGAPRAILRPCRRGTCATDNRVRPSGCA